MHFVGNEVVVEHVKQIRADIVVSIIIVVIVIIIIIRVRGVAGHGHGADAIADFSGGRVLIASG